ncbi:tripartite tricarboxylate transporter substrate binding protein BugE [Pigmentiphaga soli]|uniref:Tripartite tricarboxylate transporter substrate binding protein BugE n=1 Tax=Pigmentiphaga soli TaxID=1007095 RepID=A0ABP8GK09_9BURK
MSEVIIPRGEAHAPRASRRRRQAPALRLALACASAAAGLSVAGAHAAGDAYPSHAVRVIVPYVPGGASDIMARTIVTGAVADLGQTAVVENKPGGNAMIGSRQVARSDPDGYTLLVVDAAFTIGPSVQTDLPYDPVKDFAPVTMLATTSPILVVHPSVPVHSVKELIAYSKTGKLSYGTTGVGTNAHLAFAQMKLATGMDGIHVPYKGGNAQVNAVLSGEVSMALALPASIVPQVQAGKVRALAVASPKRLAVLPDVPTLQELGVPVVVQSFYGLVAPAGTPRAVIDKLHDASVRQLKSPEWAARLKELQFQPVGDTPAQFGQFISSEVQKWSGVVKRAGVKLE